MKQRKKTNYPLTVLLTVLLVSSFKLQAQTSTIRIKDMMFMHAVELPTPVDTTKMYFNLSFKIDSASFARTVTLKFGSAMDSSDVQFIQASVIQTTTNNYAVEYNGQQYEISNYTAYLPIELLIPQVEALRYITLFVEDKNAVLSDKLYYSFND
ncbi:MAG: hypothetical protein ACT4ON_15805 [Bacteroidota bacterium]